jgi:hypothetical protein
VNSTPSDVKPAADLVLGLEIPFQPTLPICAAPATTAASSPLPVHWFDDAQALLRALCILRL